MKNYKQYSLVKVACALRKAGVDASTHKQIIAQVRGGVAAIPAAFKIKRAVQKKIAAELVSSGSCGLILTKNNKIMVVKGKYTKFPHFENYKKAVDSKRRTYEATHENATISQ